MEATEAILLTNLEREIQNGVLLSFVAEKIVWAGLLSQNSTMQVGSESVWVSIQDSHTSGLRIPHSRVVVRSSQVKRQSEFRRAKGGGFNVDKIVNEIVYRLHLEQLKTATGGERRRKNLQAQQECRRLTGHYNLTRPLGAEVEGATHVAVKVSKREPGSLQRDFDKLTVKEAQNLLEAARQLGLLPHSRRASDGCKSVWDHLQEN